MPESTEYMNTIFNECGLALNAVGKLNYDIVSFYRNPSGSAGQQSYRSEVFKTIDIFLRSAGRIAFLIWPGKDERVTCNEDSTLMKHIRRHLAPSDKILLNNRILKDYYLTKVTEAETLLCKSSVSGVIGSYMPFSQQFMPAMPCFYNPVSRIFQCNGDVFNIQEIASTVYTLKAIAERKQRKSVSQEPAFPLCLNLASTPPS